MERKNEIEKEIINQVEKIAQDSFKDFVNILRNEDEYDKGLYQFIKKLRSFFWEFILQERFKHKRYSYRFNFIANITNLSVEVGEQGEYKVYFVVGFKTRIVSDPYLFSLYDLGVCYSRGDKFLGVAIDVKDKGLFTAKQ